MPMNREVIANLPLLRTLLAIRQKSQEPRFWEVGDLGPLQGAWVLILIIEPIGPK